MRGASSPELVVPLFYAFGQFLHRVVRARLRKVGMASGLSKAKYDMLWI